MPKVSSPHDRFFKTNMSDLRIAKDFFDFHLPASMRALINLDTLRLRKESYIDEQLQLNVSDILYSADFAGNKGYLYLLAEHQSTPDYWMPFRLLKYILKIMDQHLTETGSKTLPIVYPLIFYHGKQSYQHSTDIMDLFNDSALAKEIFLKPFQLVDITKIPDTEIQQRTWLSVLELCMKHIFARDMLVFWDILLDTFKKVEQAGGTKIVLSALNYTFMAGEISDHQTLVKAIQAELTDEIGGNIMTIAQRFIEEGMEKRSKAIAINLIKEGLPLPKISKVTGLSLPKIKALQKSIKIK